MCVLDELVYLQYIIIAIYEKALHVQYTVLRYVLNLKQPLNCTVHEGEDKISLFYTPYTY